MRKQLKKRLSRCAASSSRGEEDWHDRTSERITPPWEGHNNMKKYIAVAVLMLGATLASAQMLHVTSLNHEDFSNVPQDDCSRNLCKTYVDTVKGYVILNKDT